MTRHTDKEIEQAARRFERLADSMNPATAEVEGTNDLHKRPDSGMPTRPTLDRLTAR